jgi:long-chain acyl-CoA synthetase
VPVPLNLRMDPETLAFVLQDSGADVVIGSPFLAEEVQNLAAAAEIGTLFLPGVSEDGPVDVVNMSHVTADAPEEFDRVERDFDDVAGQLYTSGTTGKPKGVLLTHENLLSAVESYGRGVLGVDADDSQLLVLPLFHIYALNAIMPTYLLRGAEQVLQAEPEPEPMLRAIDDNDITKFSGVPALFTMMWRTYRENPDAYDLSSLDDVVCAAAPLADEVRRTIEQEWDVPMIEGWGMTETSPAGTLEPSRGVKKEAGCIGPPVPNIEMKIVDPRTRETKVGPEDLEPRPSQDVDWGDRDAVTGEIAIRGPQVFESYYKRPEATEAAFDDEGWFYTEDIARVDEDGYFWMIDRSDDMMIVGGENVYPAEVEDALYEHPDVEEAAVVGAPHEVKGEAPVAFVVLGEGADVSEDDLRSFSLEHVASYAHPRRIFFVDELPRSATQKVQRYKLEERLEDKLDGSLEPTDEDL